LQFPSHKKRVRECEKKRSDKNYETNEFSDKWNLDSRCKQSMMELEMQADKHDKRSKNNFCQWTTRKHQIIKSFIELLLVAWGLQNEEEW
jgi:hypothetical protein